MQSVYLLVNQANFWKAKNRLQKIFSRPYRPNNVNSTQGQTNRRAEYTVISLSLNLFKTKLRPYQKTESRVCTLFPTRPKCSSAKCSPKCWIVSNASNCKHWSFRMLRCANTKSAGKFEFQSTLQESSQSCQDTRKSSSLFIALVLLKYFYKTVSSEISVWRRIGTDQIFYSGLIW